MKRPQHAFKSVAIKTGLRVVKHFTLNRFLIGVRRGTLLELPSINSVLDEYICEYRQKRKKPGQHTHTEEEGQRSKLNFLHHIIKIK